MGAADNIKANLKADVEANGDDFDKIGFGDPTGLPIGIEDIGYFERGKSWLFDRIAKNGFMDYLLKHIGAEIDGVSISPDIWNRLPVTPPTGFTGNLKGLYQFDGPALGLTDRSGSGNHLSVNTGTEIYQRVAGQDMLVFNESNVFESTSQDLRLHADKTIEVISYYFGGSAASDTIVSFGVDGDGNAPADDITYALRAKSGTSLMELEHENGGTNAKATFKGLHIPGAITMVTVTFNASTKVATFYSNGWKQDTITMASAPQATSGTHASCKFLLGGWVAGGQQYQGWMHSLRLWDAVMSDAQVLEVYNIVKGI